MLAVVTGGAGYVGTNLACALRADGCDVRVVDLREPVRAARQGATWVRADVRDAAAMRAAFAGADIGYHLAAVISIVGGLRGLVESVNVEGVRSVAAAALDAGTPRLVHCSSVHAFDLAACAGRVADESAPRATRPDLPAYDRSKAAGEAVLREAVGRGLDAVVVHPSGILGPVDEAPSRMGAVLLAMWRGWFPALTAGGFHWVDVRDVVAVLRAAAVRGRVGESYLFPGTRCSIVELARLAAGCSGRRVTTRVAPPALLRAAAPVSTALARLTGSALLPTREALHALDTFPEISGGKAERELDCRPRPLADSLTDLYQSYLEDGRLRPGRAPRTRRGRP
jgi:dihydroflavonol-4-reductase